MENDSKLPKPNYLPLEFDDVLVNADGVVENWVLAQYDNTDYLGVVIGKQDGRFRVKCLKERYGIRYAQEFENDVDAVAYSEVFEAPIIPRSTQLDRDGKRTRKTLYMY